MAVTLQNYQRIQQSTLNHLKTGHDLSLKPHEFNQRIQAVINREPKLAAQSGDIAFNVNQYGIQSPLDLEAFLNLTPQGQLIKTAIGSEIALEQMLEEEQQFEAREAALQEQRLNAFIIALAVEYFKSSKAHARSLESILQNKQQRSYNKAPLKESIPMPAPTTPFTDIADSYTHLQNKTNEYKDIISYSDYLDKRHSLLNELHASVTDNMAQHQAAFELAKELLAPSNDLTDRSKLAELQETFAKQRSSLEKITTSLDPDPKAYQSAKAESKELQDVLLLLAKDDLLRMKDDPALTKEAVLNELQTLGIITEGEKQLYLETLSIDKDTLLDEFQPRVLLDKNGNTIENAADFSDAYFILPEEDIGKIQPQKLEDGVMYFTAEEEQFLRAEDGSLIRDKDDNTFLLKPSQQQKILFDETGEAYLVDNHIDSIKQLSPEEKLDANKAAIKAKQAAFNARALAEQYMVPTKGLLMAASDALSAKDHAQSKARKLENEISTLKTDLENAMSEFRANLAVGKQQDAQDPTETPQPKPSASANSTRTRSSLTASKSTTRTSAGRTREANVALAPSPDDIKKTASILDNMLEQLKTGSPEQKKQVLSQLDKLPASMQQTIRTIYQNQLPGLNLQQMSDPLFLSQQEAINNPPPEQALLAAKEGADIMRITAEVKGYFDMFLTGPNQEEEVNLRNWPPRPDWAGPTSSDR